MKVKVGVWAWHYKIPVQCSVEGITELCLTGCQQVTIEWIAESPMSSLHFQQPFSSLSPSDTMVGDVEVASSDPIVSKSRCTK